MSLLHRLVRRAGVTMDRIRADAVVASFGSVGQSVGARWPISVYAPELLTVGDRVQIGEFTVIRAEGGIRMGSDVLIAANVVITTRGHPIAPPRYGVVEDRAIDIGDRVWVGAGAVILQGTSIGEGAVVAAGAVVVDDVPARSLVAGVPARVVRSVTSP